MKLVKHEFPNPVLGTGRDDYIEGCKFSTSIDNEAITVDNTNIQIPISYTLKCNGLSNLIGQGKAKVIVVVESAVAYYRRAYTFPMGQTRLLIQVPKYDVVNSVVITGSIVAAEAISQFTCDELNPVYFSSATFEIRKGDILATEYSHTIYVDDSELEKPISSIFPIIKDYNLDKSIEPFFTSGQIEIHLNEQCYKMYEKVARDFNGALSRYATAAIVYPVLVEAIGKMREIIQDDEDDQNTRWYRAIEKKAEEKQLDWKNKETSTTYIANQILGDISYDSMKRLRDFFGDEFSGHEDISFGGVD